MTGQLVTMPLGNFGPPKSARAQIALVAITNLMLATCACGTGIGVFFVLAKKLAISRSTTAVIGSASAFAVSQLAPIAYPWAFSRRLVAAAHERGTLAGIDEN